MRTLYAWLWIGWLAAFVVIEGSAFLIHKYQYTLSEFVWRLEKFGHGWTFARYFVAVFLIWLAGHMIFRWWR